MPRIVYLSWPAGEIAGGIKAIFQHVEALAEHDFTAAVATEDAQPPQWFPSSVNVIALEDVTAEDLLVFPENHVGLLERFASGDHWKYVFCQNQYQVARGLGGRRSYVQYGVRELICPSFSVLHYCRRRFPRMRQSYVPYYIDTDRFQPQTEKRLQIAFVARKRSLEASFIHDQLRAEHQEFRDVPWVQLDGSSEQQIATALGNSAVFLSLSRFESFGLTTLEALACGCLTAGFTGVGGREYASTRNGFWVEEDDCVTCVARLAEAVRIARQQGELYLWMTHEAVATAKHYRRQTFLHQLTDFWRRQLSSQTSAATAPAGEGGPAPP